VVAGGKPIALRASGTARSWTAQIPEAAAEWTPSVVPSAAPTSAGSEGTG